MILKKFIPFLLVIVLSLAVSGCGSSDEETADSETDEETTVSETEEIPSQSPSEFYVAVEPGTSLTVRKTPGTGGPEDVVTRLARNEKVLLMDKHNNTVTENDYIWWEIIIASTQDQGWVASDFLSPVMLEEDQTAEDVSNNDLTTFNPDEYVGATRADFMNKYGYPEEIEYVGGIEFNHYPAISATVCYSRLINRSKIIKIKVYR